MKEVVEEDWVRIFISHFSPSSSPFPFSYIHTFPFHTTHYSILIRPSHLLSLFPSIFPFPFFSLRLTFFQLYPSLQTDLPFQSPPPSLFLPNLPSTFHICLTYLTHPSLSYSSLHPPFPPLPYSRVIKNDVRMPHVAVQDPQIFGLVVVVGVPAQVRVPPYQNNFCVGDHDAFLGVLCEGREEGYG